MKRIFMVTGELSGDHLAAWYVNRLKNMDEQFVVDAVGGDSLKAAGAHIYERFEMLNVVGIVEIIKHVPRLLCSLKNVRDHILDNCYDEVILVDFPGFNLRLARKLKEKKQDIKITYLSPPQLWCWGGWRIKSLKKYCDKLIVLYPFEVEWYKKRGVSAQWLGSPVYERLRRFISFDPVYAEASSGKPHIAILPGSRQSEIETLLPHFLAIAQRLQEKHPEVRFILPVARSIAQEKLECVASTAGFDNIWSSVQIITDEQEKYSALRSCSLAISKPGTVTLELALLGVPTVVVYKTSWLTYFLARMVVQVDYMSLPSLLLNKQVFKEFIQYDTDAKTVGEYASMLYESCSLGGQAYKHVVSDCQQIVHLLSGE